MYLTHGSRASVEGFGDRDGRRGARGTEDHREVRGIGDSSESLVGSDPGDIAGKQQPRTCRADAAPHDGRRPGRGQEGAGCQRRFPVITARSMDCSSEPGCHRRRGRGSSESPAPLRGREANARPRHAGLPGPAGRHRAAGPGRARAGPDHGAGHPGRWHGGPRRRLEQPVASARGGTRSRPIRSTPPSSGSLRRNRISDLHQRIHGAGQHRFGQCPTPTPGRTTDTDVPIYWVSQTPVGPATVHRRLRGLL